MQFDIKSRELWILIIVSVMAFAANLPDSLGGYLIERNLLLATLAVTVFISLFRYLKLMLFLTVSVLAIGANLPDQLASQLNISRIAFMVASCVLVVISVLYKFYHQKKVTEEPESATEEITVSDSNDTIESRIAVVSAIAAGDLAALHQLLVTDVEINFSQNGHIPLFLAIEQGHADMVLMLLVHGAKLRVRNKAGMTPLEFALTRGNERIQSLLYYAARQNLAMQHRSAYSIQQRKRMVVLFADICGSTALYDQLGNEVAFNVITRTLNILSQEVVAHKGTLIKTIGDEVMCTFPTITLATKAARAMQSAVDTRRPGGEHAVHIRIGYHYGEVIHKANDVFGDTVNVASRIAAITRARQIMTTQAVAEALPAELKGQIRPITRAALRGKQNSFHLYQILWEPEGSFIGRIGNALLRKRHDRSEDLVIAEPVSEAPVEQPVEQEQSSEAREPETVD